jgi:sugar phosphate isomerase/epimerase
MGIRSESGMMNRFIIGQYGSFDNKKYKRDFREGFYGIEACSFGSGNDTANLLKEARQRGFRIGVHFPLRAGLSPLRDALFQSKDRTVRVQAYDLIQQELEFLATIKPSYILFHYPKPVILDDKVDWSKWRFAHRSEYEYESEYSFEEFKVSSEMLFEWLSLKGREYNFTPILEFDALNKYVYDDKFLVQLLEQYTGVRLCLDTARLYLQQRLDGSFDSISVLKQYAKFADTIHLSNVHIDDDNRIHNNHYPVLPTQDPREGWAPIEQYLNIIHQENKSVKIMFEHRSDWVTDEELEECYNWVHGILN